MTAGFFPDEPLARLLLALICYVGALLYATSFSMRGIRQEPSGLFVALLYLGLWPVGSATWGFWLLQFSLVISTIAALGAVQLHMTMLRQREVRAYQAGTIAQPLSLGTHALIFLPAVLVTAIPVLQGAYALTQEGHWGAMVVYAQAPPVLAAGTVYVFAAVVVFASYIAATIFLDRAWLQMIGRIRLLSADARFAWINVFMSVASIACVAVILTQGFHSRAGAYSLFAIVVLTLIPGLNGLAWMYDAVFRRLITLHVLLVIAAAVIFGIRTTSAHLGLSSFAGWMLTLGVLAGLVIELPERIDAVLERWLFPRAALMRARLMAVVGEVSTGVTRAAAAADLLQRLIEVLDSEGGIILVEPSTAEPLTVQVGGSVDANALAATPAEALAYLDTLGVRDAPQVIENLPFAHQLRLLRAGIIVICPLTGHRREAIVLLAPRRGWLFDAATLQALKVFAAQAGLALENLALASARAHAEKLGALGEAAARIAHEIRNPLGAARSLMQLAGEADGVGELTTPAITELDRIGQLVNDLLAFARRDEVIARTRVDLAAVCRSALMQVSPLARQGDIDVREALAAVTVDADANRLVQVIANLCRNAIEALATTSAPRQLSLSCSSANGSACIEVRDTGPGISGADIGRIFEPFATTKSAGTGLGLPIARRIVEAHGGTLTVESAPGTETVFRVVLPA